MIMKSMGWSLAQRRRTEEVEEAREVKDGEKREDGVAIARRVRAFLGEHMQSSVKGADRGGRGSYAPGMRIEKLSVGLLCALLLVGTVLAGQQATTSQVTIVVNDPQARAIAHAQIRLVPPPDPPPAKMETNDAGELSLDMKPGSYGLFVTRDGFKMAVMHLVVELSKEGQTVIVGLRVGYTGSPRVEDSATFKDSLLVSAYPYHEQERFWVADLKSRARMSVTVHNEHTKADETYTGVRLSDILEKLGAPLGKELRGVAMSTVVVARGSDGYEAVLTLAEVDPSFHPGEVLVADTMNGQPLDAKSGPFKLVVSEDKRPARSVHNLVAIELTTPKKDEK
jgi:hypothetical protein